MTTHTCHHTFDEPATGGLDKALSDGAVV
ncbi:MAG: hypothetical protein QOI74_3506, partial [Micromonosporaceae bacterium]|nr:hypothetical protein [Micromonosporaceae bacterium]